MTDAMKRVAAGAGREVVLVSGEAGLGKTTLVAEAARLGVRRRGVRVVRALRGRSRDAVPAVRRSTRSLRHPRRRSRTASRTSGRTARSWRDSCRQLGEPDAGSAAVEGDRRRHASGTCCSPPSWACWSRCRASGRSCWCSTTCNGPTRPACSCSVTWSRPKSPMRLLVLGTYRDSELSRSQPFVETLAALHR